MVVVRVVGFAVLTGWAGWTLGRAWLGWSPGDALPCFLLACVGAVVGAVAGAAREITAARRPKEEDQE